MLAADTEPVKCRGIPLCVPNRSCHGRLPRNHATGWWTVPRLVHRVGRQKRSRGVPEYEPRADRLSIENLADLRDRSEGYGIEGYVATFILSAPVQRSPTSLSEARTRAGPFLFVGRWPPKSVFHLSLSGITQAAGSSYQKSGMNGGPEWRPPVPGSGKPGLEAGSSFFFFCDLALILLCFLSKLQPNPCRKVCHIFIG